MPSLPPDVLAVLRGAAIQSILTSCIVHCYHPHRKARLLQTTLTLLSAMSTALQTGESRIP
jgi:hypothetical protein